MSTTAAVGSSPAAGPADALVRLRKFPSPYQAMLAVCSDIDRTSISRFRNIHRFLNTRQETPMGPGVGLDIADSMWVLKVKGNNSDISLLRDHDLHTPESYADELAHYAEVGWIDTLHTYGNFTAGPGEVVFERRHAEAAIAELVKRNIWLPVWINHGSEANVQNFGEGEPQLGDIPGSRAYHTDLLAEYGIRFCWNHLHGASVGRDDPLAPLPLRDGRRLWGFSRYTSAVGNKAMDVMARHRQFYAQNPPLRRDADSERVTTMLWWPALIESQLAGSVLDELIEGEYFCIAAQHLGDLGEETEFSQGVVETFRRLRRRQDAGEILVARTSRLLEYSRTASHLRYEVRGSVGQLYIDITEVRDPVLGTFVPTLEQVRGITFYVPDPANTHLFLNGRSIRGGELVRAAADADEATIGVRWFDADETDHSIAADSVKHEVRGGQPTRQASSGGIALSWVHDVLLPTGQPLPEGIDGDAYTAAAEYAAGKFARGIDYYERMAARMGFVARDHVLDLGSGGGHWSIGFAAQNRDVVGVEPDEGFVKVARKMADHYGVSDRVTFIEGRAEDAVLPEASFDLICCHSVLMAVDHEATLMNVARWIREGGLFYCGYTTTGTRVRDVVAGLLDGERTTLQRGLRVLLADARERAGIGARHSVRALAREEVMGMCELLGFDDVASPDVQDGPRSYHGLASTFDFVCQRRRGGGLGDMRSVEFLSPEWRERIRKLIDAGLPALALQAFAAEDFDPDDEESAELYLRARLRRGEAIDDETALLRRVGEPMRWLLYGMSSQLSARYEEALDAYARITVGTPRRALLATLCLLEAGRYEEAMATMSADPAPTDDPLTAFAIMTAALLGARGPTAARQPAIDLFSRLREEGVAPAEEADELISQLS